MARAARRGKASASVGARPKGGMNKSVVMLVLAALVPFSLPTVIMVGLCMLPTLVAFVTEKGEHKYAWACVGGLNFAGVIPYLFSLWFGVHTVEESFNLVTDGGALFWSYGGAAAGWCIYLGMPPLVSGWLSFITDRRVNSLQGVQRKLVELWGEEVTRKD